MKAILAVACIFLLMTTVSIGGFLLFNEDQDIAMISAAVGNEQDCEGEGAFAVNVLSAIAWAWFQVPGVSERYLSEGGSFLFPAFTALSCQPGQSFHGANLARVQRNILHGVALGESIDALAPNGINLVHGAVLSNQAALLRFLADNGADLGMPTGASATFKGRDVAGRTPLQLAADRQASGQAVDAGIFAILSAR